METLSVLHAVKFCHALLRRLRPQRDAGRGSLLRADWCSASRTKIREPSVRVAIPGRFRLPQLPGQKATTTPSLDTSTTAWPPGTFGSRQIVTRQVPASWLANPTSISFHPRLCNSASATATACARVMAGVEWQPHISVSARAIWKAKGFTEHSSQLASERSRLSSGRPSCKPRCPRSPFCCRPSTSFRRCRPRIPPPWR